MLFVCGTHVSFYSSEFSVISFCATPPAGCFVAADSVHVANRKGSRALKTVSLSISLEEIQYFITHAVIRSDSGMSDLFVYFPFVQRR